MQNMPYKVMLFGTQVVGVYCYFDLSDKIEISKYMTSKVFLNISYIVSTSSLDSTHRYVIEIFKYVYDNNYGITHTLSDWGYL